MDYLVGKGVNVAFDKKNVKRLQDIEKLDNDVKDKLYFVSDNIIQNTKAKSAGFLKNKKPPLFYKPMAS